MRKPGQMREIELMLSLNEPLGNYVLQLGQGDQIAAKIRLESVHEGILASAALGATAAGECSRCLEPINVDVDVDFQELFAYSGQSDDDLLVVSDQIDIEQPVIDSVVGSLPFKPVCSENCIGLCPECGFRMQLDPDHAHDAVIDSRWSELSKLQIEEE